MIQQRFYHLTYRVIKKQRFSTVTKRGITNYTGTTSTNCKEHSSFQANLVQLYILEIVLYCRLPGLPFSWQSTDVYRDLIVLCFTLFHCGKRCMHDMAEPCWFFPHDQNFKNGRQYFRISLTIWEAVQAEQKLSLKQYVYLQVLDNLPRMCDITLGYLHLRSDNIVCATFRL